MSLNRVMLICNVGRNPEVREVNGAKVAQFSVATSERYKDKMGNPQESTEWHNIVCWRGLAELAEKWIKKGSQLYIEGHLKTRSWTTDKGDTRYATDIIAERVQFVGSKPAETAAPNAKTESRPYLQGENLDFDPDDLPIG